MWAGVQIDSGTRQEYPSLNLTHEHLWDTEKLGHAYRAHRGSWESEVNTLLRNEVIETQEYGLVTMPCYQKEVDVNGAQYYFTQIDPPAQDFGLKEV